MHWNLPFTISGWGCLEWGHGWTVQAWAQEPGSDTVSEKGLFVQLQAIVWQIRRSVEIYYLQVTRVSGVVVNTLSLALCNEESHSSIPSTSDSFYKNSSIVEMCQNLPFTISGWGCLEWGCGWTIQDWMQEPGSDTVSKKGLFVQLGAIVWQIRRSAELFHLQVTKVSGVVVNTPSLAPCNEESCS